jgi:hypothetical protein
MEQLFTIELTIDEIFIIRDALNTQFCEHQKHSQCRTNDPRIEPRRRIIELDKQIMQAFHNQARTPGQ